MPLDPNLSLQVQSPAAASGAAVLNPIALMGSLSEIQNRVNKNRLFQQEFAAKQLGGQIIAAAPDLETGLNNLWKHPDTAAFAGPMINAARQSQLTMLEMQGRLQEQSTSGLQGILKALPAVMADPSQWEHTVNAHLATLSPAARARVLPAVEDIRRSLIDGLPTDVTARTDMLNRRLTGQMLAAGITPDVVHTLMGTIPRQLASPGPYGTGGAPAQPERGGLPVTGAGTGAGAGAAAPPPVSLGPIGPTQTQGVANEGIGKLTGQLQEEMSSMAGNLPGAMKRVDMLANSLTEFQSGGGADTREHIARFAQALRNIGVPITDEAINRIGNSSLPANQIFNAEIKPFVTAALREAAYGTGAGRIKSEVDAFLQSMGSTTDPRALVPLLNQFRYQMQVNYDKSQKFIDFKQGIAKHDPELHGLDISDFEGWYARHFSDKSLPVTNAGGGFSFAPTQPGQVLGGQPGGAGTVTHRWDPMKGLAVPVTPPAQQ